MGSRSAAQLRAMLRKNWLLKKRHPFTTAAEVLLPTAVMFLLIAVRTRVDTTVHPVQAHIREGMFVEVGRSQVSPSFDAILNLMVARGEHLAFAPDNEDTRSMLGVLSWKFPLLQAVGKIYKDEEDLEAYIRSDDYGISDKSRNLSNPLIRGAIVFHEQGPQVFDYSIRLNHTWAFSGFPDVKTIMDVNGPYLNDLALGVDIVPTLQYSYSGFLTLQQVMDSFLIFAAQQRKFKGFSSDANEAIPSVDFGKVSPLPWTLYSPKNVNIVPFPTRAYTDDEFQTIIKKVMGVLYLLGFLFPVSRLVSYAVYEKELKIKEGLFMMGLKDEIFYLSWFITYILQFAVSSAIITACTMSSLFLYSDKSLVFTYFFVFGVSAVMLSFLISTFFSRAKTAVAVGTLSFLGAFFPYYTVNDPAVSLFLKTLASVLSPTAFALGTVNFADYERAHVGLRWSNIWQESSGVNFLVCLLMMIFDSVLYCAIGLYLDKVIPRENGLRYSWDFLFKKSSANDKDLFGIHNEIPELRGEEKQLKLKRHRSSKGNFQPVLEPTSLEMKQLEAEGRCILIRNLHKVFMSRKGKCCAINSLNLTLYENQILALLGHNGAGKSTTISILVGLLHPTSGDALVLGKNIRTEMDEIRKGLGVCPQYDILFSELTVKEHLQIFAILKGVEEELLEAKVNDMVNEVGLVDKLNVKVGALSGGMKRKLSLGIALIGNSKVIILDEPTSGMDPYSMRSTWQLIKRIKKGRIVLLTTHSMDEADILGDRIAIMANGSLKCCGSSIFLKHQFGVGYTLTIAKSAPTASVAADIVRRHIPSATCLSDVGSEISFRLPLAAASSFHHMFQEIECSIHSNVVPSQSGSHEISHGIESYGVSVTTLEEVFLKVSDQAFESEHNQYNSNEPVVTVSEPPVNSQKEVPTAKTNIPGYMKVVLVICSTAGGFFCGLLSVVFGLMASLIQKACLCGFCTNTTFWRHCKALIIKRALSARRDRRTVLFQLFLPSVFLFFGLLLLRLKPHPDQSSITLTTSLFNPLLRGGGGGGPIPFNLSLPISNKVSCHVKGGWIQKEEPRSFKFPDPNKTLADAVYIAGPVLGPALVSMSEYLITSLNESYQSRYGAIVMDEQYDDGSLGYTVLHNSSCQHGAPTFINEMNAAILRLAVDDENMTIQTRNHPLPQTKSQHLQHHDLDAFSASIVVAIAFSFIPASFAVAIVKEREVRAKHQQLISGVSTLAYWVSAYLWDFVSFLFPTAFAVVLFFIFDLNQFIGYGCLLPTISIFLEFGLAVASSTYCLSFFFSDHSVAQNTVLLVHFFLGLILMVVSFIMGLLTATKSINSFLKNFFRLSPAFCFADGLASLALRRQGMKLGYGSGTEILDWNVTGASICYLGIESIVYFLLVIAIENSPQNLSTMTIKSWWNSATSRQSHKVSESSSEPLLGSIESHCCLADEDVDVQAERNRVISGAADNAIIYLRNLRKVYPGGINQSAKVAVHSLTFSVQAGECFGFLGTNGAGKTTTLSMLSGEERPTNGTAYIFGNDISLRPKAARRHVGYCPQFDALLEFLTVREHLELYARIKEVPDSRIAKVVDEKLVEFDLCKHENKPSFSLSGGNKRKLSVAIAMIGDPPIVILDEPSTGMDPIAKRFMWDVISRLSTRQGKTAVILTTHSMNEAQALCTRIGIMVSGKLKCIGSPQHLKTRYGNHLELEVKATEVHLSELDELSAKIQELVLDFPCHSRSILAELEVCIGRSDTISEENTSEISLTRDMILPVAHWLGNKDRVCTLVSSSPGSYDAYGEQLSEQLTRDGGIPLRIFSEWWLTKEKLSNIDRFILSSFPGATLHGCNSLSFKYQLPYGEGCSLADIFGHLEYYRKEIGIQEYSVSQSTLETIFNHFATLHSTPA